MKECLFSDSKRSIVPLNQEGKLSHLSNHKSESISKPSQKKGNSFFVQCLLLLVVVFTLFITSCNKAEEPQPLSNASEQAQSLGDVVAYNPSTYSTIYSSRDVAYGVRSSLSVNYTQALRGTIFKFEAKIEGIHPQDKNAFLHFEAPSGAVVDVQMLHRSDDVDMAFFELNRMLQQYGEYKVSLYEQSRYAPNKIDLRCSLKVFVLHPPISLGDNYWSLNRGGLAEKNCTAWVCGKVNEMWKDNSFQKLLGTHGRHAKVWRSRLAEKGYSSDSNPRIGDIAWWKENIKFKEGSNWITVTRENGHVAFVNDVSADGTITITEYNGRYPERYSSRTISPGTLRYPTSFIHVQTKRQ